MREVFPENFAELEELEGILPYFSQRTLSKVGGSCVGNVGQNVVKIIKRNMSKA